MAPILTIATINKDNAIGLRRTIESVLLQEDPRFEYVVIDGLSKDESCDVANSHLDRLSFFESKADKGISDAFNRALIAARGEWILLLNSGDSLADGVLARICDILESSKSDLVICSTEMRGGNLDGKVLAPIYSKLHLEMSIPHPSTFVKKSVYEIYGMYDLSFKLAMDYEFFLRSRNRIAVTECDFVATIMDGCGISSQGVWRRNIECWHARKINGFGTIVNYLYTMRRMVREWVAAKGLA